MAIKKRSMLTEEERAAKIAAFGDAATSQMDAPAETPELAPTLTAAQTPGTSLEVKAEAGESVAQTTLIRWPKDKELRIAIGQIAKAEERSVHAMILRLLRNGVDTYNAKR